MLIAHRYASSLISDLYVIEGPDSVRAGVSSEVDSESDWIHAISDDERIVQTWIRVSEV